MAAVVLVLLLPVVLSAQHITTDIRIVNGQDATPGEFPWQVSLQIPSNGTYRHICGAVVLDENRILTAAHCVYGEDGSNIDPTRYRIVVGDHSLNQTSGNEQARAVSTIKVHSSYTNTGGYNNDLAVLILTSSIAFNEYVQPVTLPLAAQPFEGKPCYITGWGRTVGGGSLPDILQKAETTAITHSSCLSSLGLAGLLYLQQAHHICVYTGNSAACNGDSGGPLVCDVSSTNVENWQLAGVTSWGLANCPMSSPSVYVRISNYLTWIGNQ